MSHTSNRDGDRYGRIPGTMTDTHSNRNKDELKLHRDYQVGSMRSTGVSNAKTNTGYLNQKFNTAKPVKLTSVTKSSYSRTAFDLYDLCMHPRKLRLKTFREQPILRQSKIRSHSWIAAMLGSTMATLAASPRFAKAVSSSRSPLTTRRLMSLHAPRC